MSTRKVPGALTEEALQLLSAVFLDSRDTHVTPVTGRIASAGKFGVYDPGLARSESAYLRMISVVEAYVDTLSSARFERKLTGQAEIFRLLVLAAERKSSRSWSERKDAFLTYHLVALVICDRWSELDAGIEARNAIAHGLGRLTLRQRNHKSRAKIASVEIAVVDDRILITDASLARCYAFCAGFISSVDSKVQD